MRFFLLINLLIISSCFKEKTPDTPTNIEVLRVSDVCLNIDSTIYVKIQNTLRGKLITPIEFGGQFGKIVRVYDKDKLMYVRDEVLYKRLDCAELMYPTIQ